MTDLGVLQGVQNHFPQEGGLKGRGEDGGASHYEKKKKPSVTSCCMSVLAKRRLGKKGVVQLCIYKLCWWPLGRERVWIGNSIGSTGVGEKTGRGGVAGGGGTGEGEGGGGEERRG